MTVGTAWLFCHQIGQPITAEDVFVIIAAGHLVPYASTRWRSPPQIRGSGPCVGKKTKRTRKMPGRPRSLSSTTAPLHHHHMALAFAHPRQHLPLYNAWIKPSVSLCADIQFYEWSDMEGFIQAFNKYKMAFRLSMRSHKASQHIDYNLLDLLRFFHPLQKTKACLHNVWSCLPFQQFEQFWNKNGKFLLFFYNTPLSENEDGSVDKQQAYEIKKFRLLRPKPSTCTIHKEMKRHDKKKNFFFLLPWRFYSEGHHLMKQVFLRAKQE